MNSEIKNYIDTLYNNLLRQIRKKQILYSDIPLSGVADDCYVFGINYMTGDIYYRDENDIWELISTGISGGIKHYSITQLDFEPDGITYLNPVLVSDNASIFWNDINRYIYQANGEWDYVTGGIQILIPGFDANTNLYNLEIITK